MMTQKAKTRTGLALALLLALSFVVPVIADQPPRIPAGFYGTVQINGEYVPDGTIVSAWINGVQYAETTTFTATINMEQASVYTLEVPGDDPTTPEIEGGEEGDPIVFKVDGHDADQGGAWHEGTDTELNLHATVNYPPTTVSVGPSGFTSMPEYLRTMLATYEDPNGWQDLADVYFMWNLSASDNTQQVRYEVAANKLYIRDDANSQWVGGFTPGTDISISNTNLTLDVAGTSVVTTTTQVRVTWGLIPNQPMTSVNWNSYLKAVDSAFETTGWVNRGTWRVNMFPNVGGVSPASGTAPAGTPQVFTTTYSDEDGAGTTWRGFIRATEQAAPFTNHLYAYYDQFANKMYLYDGINWLGGLTPGVTGTIETASVSLDVGASSVATTTKTLSISWTVTFKSGTEGPMDVFGYVYDNQNFQDGWCLIGHWTVGSGGAVSMPSAAGAPPEVADPIPPDAPSDFLPIYRTPELDPASPLSGMIAPDKRGGGDSSMASLPLIAKPGKTSVAIPRSPVARGAAPLGTPADGIFSPSWGNRAPGWGWNFRSQFSDPSGFSHLAQLYVLFSVDGSTQNAIYLRYDQNTNRLYLRDSADTAWIGGYAPGSSVKISNDKGTLDVSKTWTNSYGNYMDVFWQVIFKSTGQSQHYRIFVKAVDDSNNTLDWVEKGWHRVNMWAANGGVTPASNVQSVGATYAYTTTYTDPEQWTDLKYVFLNVASSAGGQTQCIYAYYNVQANQIRLLNDAGTGWLGPITPGVAGDIENSWAIIHGAGSSVTGTGDKLSVTWSIEFKASMAGTTKGVYLYAQDKFDWIDFWSYVGQIDIAP